MLTQGAKNRSGSLKLLTLFLGITIIVVALFVTQYCVCPLCRVPHDNGKPCQCTSLASHLSQSVFGHTERHSEIIAKSTVPCEVKK
jgi:hypothetical protein